MSKLRVWWIPQIPGKPFYVNVDSPEEGKKIIDILVQYDLFQYENKIKPDFANTGGIEEYSEVNKEWSEWYDEDSNDW